MMSAWFDPDYGRGYREYYGTCPTQYASNTCLADYEGPIQPYRTHNDYTGYGRPYDRQLESHTPYSPYDSRVWTWSPPLSPKRSTSQLYSQSLKDLCTATRCSLSRLKMSITKNEPCYEYGIKHWHPGTDDKPSSPDIEDFEPPHTESSTRISPRWRDTSVFFGGEVDLSKDRIEGNEDREMTIPKNKFCYFCSTMEEHKKHMLQYKRMKPEKEKKARIIYVPPPPAIRRKRIEQDEGGGDMVLYRVKVKTGTVKEKLKDTGRTINVDTGTNSSVSIKIQGSDGTSSLRPLRKKVGSLDFYFAPGSTETFHLRIPDLGQLQLLQVQHNGCEEKHSWFLDEIEVTNLTTQQSWLFRCADWFSLFKKGCTLKRVLKAEDNEEDQELKDYEITIQTSKKRDAGTSANVSITMYGKAANSARIPLYENPQEKADSFRRGKVDVFKVEAKPFGRLSKIRVEHDNKGDQADWHFSKIQIDDLMTGKSYFFLYDDWLIANGRLGKAWVDLFPATVEEVGKRSISGIRKSAKQSKHFGGSGKYSTHFDVMVTTSKKVGAGTDAKVFIQLYGTDRNSHKIALDQADNNRNSFESGNTDVFKITCPDVGQVKKLLIGHDNSGFAAGWHLQKVVLRRHLLKGEILAMVTKTIRDLCMRRHSIKGKSKDSDEDSDGASHEKADDNNMNVFSTPSRRGGRRYSTYSVQEETKGVKGARRSSAEATKNKGRKQKKEIDSDSDSDTDEKKMNKKNKSKKGLLGLFKSSSSSSSSSSESEDNTKDKKVIVKKSVSMDTIGNVQQKTVSSVFGEIKGHIPQYEECVFKFEEWFATDEGDQQIERTAKPHERTMQYSKISEELKEDILKICGQYCK